MNSNQIKSKKFDPLSLLATILFGVSVVLTPVILYSYPAESFTRIIIAFVPLLLFIFFIIRFNYTVKLQDELGRRVHLEAVVLTLALIMILGMTKSSIVLAFPNWHGAKNIPDGLGLFPFLYVVGSLIVRKRYL